MIELPGLISGSPICAMAAMGLLRVLGEDLGRPAALGWRGGRAVLAGIDDPDALVNLLAGAMAGRAEAREFTWAEGTRRVEPARYRDACVTAVAAGDTRALAFMAAWGTDTVLREGCVAPTRLDLTSGRVLLIAGLRGLAASLANAAAAREAYRSALFGGPYARQNAFGWDPVAVRRGATESTAPAKSEPPGKPGLVWLAAEGLPLHPVMPAGPARTRTVGCTRDAYVWPLWDALLSLEEVRLLRALAPERLAGRAGVLEVWRSDFDRSGKYGVLLPAVRER